MPRIPDFRHERVVYCPACNHAQPDAGKRVACGRCGCQPVPSYAYPQGSVFYPGPPMESQQRRIERLVAERRVEKEG
jgi:hypothetical protein